MPGSTTSVSSRSSVVDSRAAIASASAALPASKTVVPWSRSTWAVNARTPASSSTISTLAPRVVAAGAAARARSGAGEPGNGGEVDDVGSSTVKRAPRAGALCTWMSPPLCLTMP
jgi:hypothetical protein